MKALKEFIHFYRFAYKILPEPNPIRAFKAARFAYWIKRTKLLEGLPSAEKRPQKP